MIIFAWMYIPEGVDNRYTKRITGENVGSTASVARNSHAMVTLCNLVFYFVGCKFIYFIEFVDIGLIL